MDDAMSASLAAFVSPPLDGLSAKGPTMNLFRTFLVVACALGVLTGPSVTLAREVGQDLVLRNPSNSVHVRVHPCGKNALRNGRLGQ